jgi:predicted nucleic acid-binding Zn ribbon protein
MRKTARLACLICNDAIPQPKTGRSRRTCSAACRQKLWTRNHAPRARDKHDAEKRRKVERQIAAYEAKFGDLSKFPGSRSQTAGKAGVLNLRVRLTMYLMMDAPIPHCWTCGRPYILDGVRTDTCSEQCTRKQQRYYKRLKRNFYDNPRQLPEDVSDYIRKGKRLQFCAHCDDPFVPTRADRKYCTARCRKAAYEKREAAKAQQRARRSENRKRHRWANARVYTRHCLNCGTLFNTTNSCKLYCKRACTLKARNRRKTPPMYRDCTECRKSFEVTRRYKGVHYQCSTACLLAAGERGLHPHGWLHRCVLCGTEYEPAQSMQEISIYCSDRCRDAVWRLAGYELEKVFGGADGRC